MLGLFDSKHEAAADSGPSWQQRLKQGLTRTREVLNTPVSDLLIGRRLDEATLEELEAALLVADVGVDAARFLIEDLEARIRRAGPQAQASVLLRAALLDLLTPLEQPLEVSAHKPFVIMLAGVNGAGKTTSIGKLAKYFQGQGRSVLLAAGDTFRAAAREQLSVWGERNQVAVIGQDGGDPAAVIFDAVHAARARNIDVVLADTAGRLPTQLNLMDEIRKVKRVIAKAEPGAPHEVLLVLDAGIGQNALSQVKAFDDAIGVTGLVLTKLDGTAKGGVIAGIARARPARPIPIRFIGVGESMDDLQPFKADEFVAALFDT
jgi:fused signal recognition particle receptor